MASQLETLLTSGSLTKNLFIYTWAVLLCFVLLVYEYAWLPFAVTLWADVRQLRFGAYKVGFFKSKIIIAIIIKNWSPHPTPTTELSMWLWVGTFWFFKLAADGPELDSISRRNCFLHEDVFSRTVCDRCFNGKLVYLYVNNFLQVIGLVDGKAQIRCFPIFKVYC